MLVNRLPEVVFWNPWLDAYFHWVKVFCDTDPVLKRGYIQHPSEIPLKASLVNPPPANFLPDQAPSQGLCFETAQPFAVGSDIHISIALNGSEFEGDAKVAWVEEQGESRRIVGVNFSDKDESYGIRMAEQICHIEHYRRDILLQEGRNLSAEEAAAEWVDRYASAFPEHF